MTELKYKFTNDTLFKMLFTKHPGLLKKLVAALLRISYEDIKQFEIRNSEMPPESWGEKFCRLDINLEVNGQRVDCEVQVENEGNYPERSLYYFAREFSSSLPASGRYGDLPRTVIASILAFELFPCIEYYSEYEVREVTRHTRLSDKMSLIFFELPKLPLMIPVDNGLEIWLSLFRAKTEEELARLAELGVPEMREAIEAYKHITVTSEFKEAERLRSKARHDEAQALFNAEQKGQNEKAINVAKNAIHMGFSTDDIVMLTGLTRETVESLRK